MKFLVNAPGARTNQPLKKTQNAISRILKKKRKRKKEAKTLAAVAVITLILNINTHLVNSLCMLFIDINIFI